MKQQLRFLMLTLLCAVVGTALAEPITEAIVLAEQGYDPQLGARPVKRLIQKEIVNNLSKELIAGHLPMDSNVVVDYKEGKIVFENEKE